MALCIILLSVILAAIFKYGRRYVSKMVKFRKMSITYDKINLTTCKWAQVVPLKILHLLVRSLLGFCMLTTRILQINEQKIEFRGFFITGADKFSFSTG